MHCAVTQCTSGASAIEHAEPLARRPAPERQPGVSSRPVLSWKGALTNQVEVHPYRLTSCLAHKASVGTP